MKLRPWMYAVGAGAVGATFVFWPRLRPDERVIGWPTSKRLKYAPLPETARPGDAFTLMVGPVRLAVYLDGKPVMRTDLAASKALSAEMQGIWASRRKTLPAAAKSGETDDWSKELYWAPSWLVMIPPAQLTSQNLLTAVNGTPVDEFGRLQPGHFGETDMSIWGQTLGGLMKNNLFRYAVIAAVIASGPEGVAIYGAYNMWQSRGELTAKNVAFAAARAYIVSQCGEGCGIAFDMGLGVAQGKSAQQTAKESLLKQMSPQARLAFEQGERTYRKASS